MKKETQDIYHEAINKVVDYINGHLYAPHTTKSLASVANLSEYHFHRIFKSIIGEPLGSYVVRLRLADIASRLRITQHSLNLLAEQTSYQSKHALSKEFKKHFGINPSEFRTTEQNFACNFRYTKQLKPEIQTITGKTAVYLRIIGEYGEAESYVNAWKKLYAYGKENDLLTPDSESLGISFDDPTISSPAHCRFYACFTTDKPVKPHGEFGVKTIDSGLYAIFTLKGSYSGLQDLYNAICFNWLPDSGYHIRKGTMFEKYLNNPNKVDESEILTEVYMPVKEI